MFCWDSERKIMVAVVISVIWSLRNVVIMICRNTAKFSLTCPIACLGKSVLIILERAHLCPSNHSACKHSRKIGNDTEKSSDGGVEALLIGHWELLPSLRLLSFFREGGILMTKVWVRSWSGAGRLRCCWLLNHFQARWVERRTFEESPYFQHISPEDD